jgi:ATP-dependent Lhr-like helicase
VSDPLAQFGPATQTWFHQSFAEPTAVQARGWASIAAGRHTLMLAPTGSGKTLAAFLWSWGPLTILSLPDATLRSLQC